MPFYIRTGKKLGRREMEVAVVFRTPAPEIPPVVLLVKFQPTEGVYLQFNIKRPGDFEDIIPARMISARAARLQPDQHARSV